VELTYPGSGALPYIFTTQVYVVPDVLHYQFTNGVAKARILTQPPAKAVSPARP